jgi:hypothetical protein
MLNSIEDVLKKFKASKTVEELLIVAKENGIDLKLDQATDYFGKLNPKAVELSDEELDSVAGGSFFTKADKKSLYPCPNCTSDNVERIKLDFDLKAGLVATFLCGDCNHQYKI